MPLTKPQVLEDFEVFVPKKEKQGPRFQRVPDQGRVGRMTHTTVDGPVVPTLRVTKEPVKLEPMLLGTLVRQTRIDLGLTMPELAERSNVSRTTLHRLELDSGTQMQPSKLASVLRVLGIPSAALVSTIEDPEYRERVTEALERQVKAEEVKSWLGDAAGQRVETGITLVGQDGTMLVIQARNEGSDYQAHRKALLDFARSRGMVAMQVLDS